MEKIKKILAVICTALILVSAVPTSALAETITVRGTLQMGYNSLQTVPTGSIFDCHNMPTKTLVVDGLHKSAYCLENAKPSFGGSEYSTWDGLNHTLRWLYSDIMGLGFQWSSSSGIPSGNQSIEWLVTQLLVWGGEMGIVTKDSGTGIITITSTMDEEIERVAPHTTNATHTKTYYAQLKEKLEKMYLIPSFASYVNYEFPKTIKLLWNGTEYVGSATDTNGVLDHYDFKIDGMTTSRSGDKLTIKAPSESAVGGAKTSRKTDSIRTCPSL